MNMYGSDWLDHGGPDDACLYSRESGAELGPGRLEPFLHSTLDPGVDGINRDKQAGSICKNIRGWGWGDLLF